MLITELKSKETIASLAKGKVFIINCHGCKEIRFPEHEADELQKELAAEGKVTGIFTTDYICNADNLAIRLKKFAAQIEEADAVLVFSCGVGVQTVAQYICSFSRTSGDKGIRTLDPLRARQVLSQLSYTPIFNYYN